jgi:hypothetical protein
MSFIAITNHRSPVTSKMCSDALLVGAIGRVVSTPLSPSMLPMGGYNKTPRSISQLHSVDEVRLKIRPF